MFVTLAFLSSLSDAATPVELLAIEKKYQEAGGFEAAFKQIKTKSLTGFETISTGHVQILLPGKFRWEVLTPRKSLTVSNGIKIWVVQFPTLPNEPEQVLEETAQQAQTQLIQDLLGAKFSSLSTTQFIKLSETSFKLNPKPGELGDLESILIKSDERDLNLKEITLFHRNRDQTHVTLTQFQFKRDFARDEFTYLASPQARKIKNSPTRAR